MASNITKTWTPSLAFCLDYKNTFFPEQFLSAASFEQALLCDIPLIRKTTCEWKILKKTAYKKQKSEACLGSYAISKTEFFVTFVNGFQLLSFVNGFHKEIHLRYYRGPRSIFDLLWILWEWSKLAPSYPTLLRLQKQLNIITHQTRDQTAIDLFASLFFFRGSVFIIGTRLLQ